jgi:hypothetical protein
MDMKNTLVIVLLLTVITSCAQVTKKNDNNALESLVIAERIKAKNSAFCSCLNKVYPGYDEKLNDGSAAGYFEMSAYNIEVFEKLDSIASVFASKEYKSKYNKNLGIQKCLDFYNSKELETFIKRLDAEMDKDKLKMK